MGRRIALEKKVQAHGREISDELRRFFRERGIYVVNLIGSPGGGKTRLLEALAPRLRGHTAVIEGDLQTDRDKQRIERAGLRAYQINTQGACHLDAAMVRRAVDEFSLDGIRLLFIENVGNLVCPAGFEIGEDVKVAVVSITEGEDKPAKYPKALFVSAAMVLTKMDLLPYVECDVERMKREALEIKPSLRVFETSATADRGLDPFLDWIEASAAQRR
ncbi:hydrogenase nickel incorporation protein HypB [Candidatus Sumerlaeota bacterium]|nr:hydrogenase nickel incorporation protein HypB [Candidatus Sumerlaeota bacterium]